ncbi:dehydrogenase [Paenibacillus cellulositrophicus]|uniref:dehydrogenase n=1 Tax=Paenibacillus cellulositrophicus TaxID=562959 RepID=UPI003D96507D
MPQIPQNKKAALPTARGIRRKCSNELYRAIKRMKVHIPADLVKQGEAMYYRKVVGNLIWIHENRSNRKVQCDWWDKEVCPELAELWELDPGRLSSAFRDAYGG